MGKIEDKAEIIRLEKTRDRVVGIYREERKSNGNGMNL
jgi:hypothetical protein